MSDPSEVIDLTESFTLVDHAALLNAVIEVNDSLYEPPRHPRSPRRARGSQRRTTNAQYPIEVVDTPVENFETPVRRRKTTKQTRKQQATQCALTEHDDGEVIRERSPLDSGFGTCAICLEKFKTQPLVSTKCGHVFCQKCLLLSLHVDKKCPTCRKSLRGKNAHHPVFF